MVTLEEPTLLTSPHDPDLAERLRRVVSSTPWLADALAVVRELGPAGAYVAAGAVRDTVWNALTGRPAGGPFADVDIVYFAPDEPPACAHEHQERLRSARPALDWEVVNQAHVHHWRAGSAPHRDLDAALASWPETATAVGVRLAAPGVLEEIAPLGLEDLFALQLRHNPVLADAETFRRRVRDKRWRERWPELTLV